MGSVIAINLADVGFLVSVYEKRNHIGGNMYDYEKDGILVHKYGPHIFHTSKENVYEYMSKFWKLNNFKNIVVLFKFGLNKNQATISQKLLDPLPMLEFNTSRKQKKRNFLVPALFLYHSKHFNYKLK